MTAAMLRRRALRGAGAALLLATAQIPTVHAANAECILDNCADQRPARDVERGSGDDRGFRRNGSGPRGASVPGQFDFYVLSLSWVPGFCATGGDDKGRAECRSGTGEGFAVHGLWPQYDHGYPSDCRGGGPSQAALAITDGVYPDEKLARYEWRKHGTCSGLSPSAYFTAAKAARDTVVIPPSLRAPHQSGTASPQDVERAFTDANPRLRPGMLAAICQHGTLDEVRLCFTKDLSAFQTCPEVVRERCRSQSVSIPPVR